MHPDWQAFQSRNPWYNTTGYMRKFADDWNKLSKSGLAPADVLKQVEQAVRKEFPTSLLIPTKSMLHL